MNCLWLHVFIVLATIQGIKALLFSKPDFCSKPQAWTLSDIQPELLVYTRDKNGYRIIKDESEIPDFIRYLSDDGFLRANRQIVFIVHGYMGYMPWTSWIGKTKDSILKVEDSTVFVVKWSKGANIFYSYPTSAANTKIVGSMLATLATAILNSDTFKGDKNLFYMHCIGHSLGAHICGQAGRQSKIFDRATGLDPAGPGFENCADAQRMDVDSAACVDNIHTDGLSLGHLNPLSLHFGTLQRWGHVDFYPNGGGNQPWCWSNTVPPCSHAAAHKLFVQTIEPQSSECELHALCQGDDCPNNPVDDIQRFGYWNSCHKDSKQMIKGAFHLSTQLNGPSQKSICLDLSDNEDEQTSKNI